jgi:hypothetical protein
MCLEVSCFYSYQKRPRVAKSPHGGQSLEASYKDCSEGIIGRVFRTGRGQIKTEFDGGFEFLRMEGKAQNTIYAGLSECKFMLGGDRECDDGHFARSSRFADLVDGFDNALRARLESGSWEEAIRGDDHEIEVFATGFVREFVNASRPRGLDAGAVVADVENHDFDEVANAAIRIANQKFERFHQFKKMQPPGGMGGMRAFLHVAKQGLCQRGTRETPRN